MALQYYNDRIASLGENSYPHKFDVSTTFAQFIEKYSENSEEKDENVSIAGRIMSKRFAGKKLAFFTLESCNKTLQVIFNMKFFESEWNIIKDFNRGDIIGVVGFPCKTPRGELSIQSRKAILLSPCLTLLPPLEKQFKDVELRFRNRSLDFIMNREKREIFKIRSKIIKFIRNYLDQNDFLEVETPILSNEAGGAAAKPFVSYYNAFEKNTFLRIAPELFLKRLIVGGFERVYEIGKQFRNEDVGPNHNPEFTSLEFYWAYKDYKDLMKVSKDIISGIVFDIHQSYQIEYDGITIDFSKFTEVSFMDALNEAIGMKLDVNNLDIEVLVDLCESNNIKYDVKTVPKLLDKLSSHFIEGPLSKPIDGIANPLIIYNYPEIMCPLSKSHRDYPGLSERFEIFILGKEICNSYTEENNPIIQQEKFEQQLFMRNAGDEEAHSIDKDFIDAINLAMPPLAGFGMGIDRMTMFLTNNQTIKEVILFPMLKDE